MPVHLIWPLDIVFHIPFFLWVGDDDKIRVHASIKIIKLAFYLFKHDSLNPFTIDAVVTEVGVQQ